MESLFSYPLQFSDTRPSWPPVVGGGMGVGGPGVLCSSVTEEGDVSLKVVLPTFHLSEEGGPGREGDSGIPRCFDFFAMCDAFVFGPQSYKQSQYFSRTSHLHSIV